MEIAVMGKIAEKKMTTTQTDKRRVRRRREVEDKSVVCGSIVFPQMLLWCFVSLGDIVLV